MSRMCDMRSSAHSATARRRRAGFSYVEVLIATALIAVALVPALEALSTGIRGVTIQAEAVTDHYHLQGRLEELLAQPFDELDAEAVAIGDPTTASALLSDAPGSPRRRLVHLARYDGDDADADGDGLTGGDEGLVWISVQLENTAAGLETVTAP